MCVFGWRKIQPQGSAQEWLNHAFIVLWLDRCKREKLPHLVFPAENSNSKSGAQYLERKTIDRSFLYMQMLFGWSKPGERIQDTRFATPGQGLAQPEIKVGVPTLLQSLGLKDVAIISYVPEWKFWLPSLSTLRFLFIAFIKNFFCLSTREQVRKQILHILHCINKFTSQTSWLAFSLLNNWTTAGNNLWRRNYSKFVYEKYLLVNWNNVKISTYHKKAKFVYNLIVINNLICSSCLAVCIKLLNIMHIVIMCLYLCL